MEPLHKVLELITMFSGVVRAYTKYKLIAHTLPLEDTLRQMVRNPISNPLNVSEGSCACVAYLGQSIIIGQQIKLENRLYVSLILSKCYCACALDKHVQRL